MVACYGEFGYAWWTCHLYCPAKWWWNFPLQFPWITEWRNPSKGFISTWQENAAGQLTNWAKSIVVSYYARQLSIFALSLVDFSIQDHSRFPFAKWANMLFIPDSYSINSRSLWELGLVCCSVCDKCLFTPGSVTFYILVQSRKELAQLHFHVEFRQKLVSHSIVATEF